MSSGGVIMSDENKIYTSKKKKRWRVYKFPSLYGTPIDFKWKWQAIRYAFIKSIFTRFYIFELEDLKTGEYKAYWI